VRPPLNKKPTVIPGKPTRPKELKHRGTKAPHKRSPWAGSQKRAKKEDNKGTPETS